MTIPDDVRIKNATYRGDYCCLCPTCGQHLGAFHFGEGVRQWSDPSCVTSVTRPPQVTMLLYQLQLK